ncbi:MAG TPA: hypothetical protein VG206_00705 [Terriglobia bacterium]|nr:hypothetical protein [Terriglobia bacterium]
MNEERFEDHDSWMLFGGMSSRQTPAALDWAGVDSVLIPPWTSPEFERVQRGLGKLTIEGGRILDSRRTSLEKPRAPEDQLRTLFEQFGFDDLRDIPEPEMHGRAELLDAQFSHEIIKKLEKIVERAALLDPHEVSRDQIHHPSFRGCFQEAHRCYLYGFSRASAVMCRALTESALKDRFDAAGEIEAKLQPRQSLFNTLLKSARLADPLPEHAKEIWRCGGFAAHNDPKFGKEYESQGKLADIMCWTRGVLAALYPTDASGGTEI